MRDDDARPEIEMARIRIGSGIAGLIFAAGSTVIFLIGIPALRYMLPAAFVLGCGIAVGLHFIPYDRHAPGIFPGAKD
jgi:hypothetical protein